MRSLGGTFASPHEPRAHYFIINVPVGAAGYDAEYDKFESSVEGRRPVPVHGLYPFFRPTRCRHRDANPPPRAWDHEPTVKNNVSAKCRELGIGMKPEKVTRNNKQDRAPLSLSSDNFVVVKVTF